MAATQTHQADERWASVNGVKIRYLAAGQGPPVVLLHGLGGWAERWQGNIAALAREFTVLAPDRVGFGRSDKPRAAYTLPYFAWMLVGFLDALRLPRAALVGNSLGGAEAIQALLDFPDRVTALVLVSPVGFGRDTAYMLRLLSLPLLPTLLRWPSIPRVRDHFARLFVDPAYVREEIVAEAVDLLRLPGGRDAYLRTVRHLQGIRGIRRRWLTAFAAGLPHTRTPTLILWGEEDRLLPVAHAREAARLLPAARVVTFPRCGHLPQVEAASEFNRSVADFLRAID